MTTTNTINETNINEMTFGVELEVTFPRNELPTTITSANYRRGINANNDSRCNWTLPQGWEFKYDASISAEAGRSGIEVVSPVLRGTNGLHQIIEVCNTINAHGAKVNRSTGLHVHVGFDRSNAKAIERLTSLVANFEKAIFASTGTKSREHGSWCAGMHQHGNAQNAIASSTSNRYHVLNWSNLLGYGHGTPTAEFRAFAGSTNASKIIGYVRLCLSLVERSLVAKRNTNWTAKTPVGSSPIARREGEGTTAFARLMYQLGWTKGRSKVVYGNLTAEGLPTIKESKKTLVALAKKYDSR